MSFKFFYKNLCIEERIPTPKDTCNIEETTIDNNQWWTLKEPYLVRGNTYHVPTVFSVGRTTFPARDLTNENREEVMKTFELYAYEIMLEELEIPLNRIVSSRAIDIYAEPVRCYPLKVLVEVVVDVS